MREQFLKKSGPIEDHIQDELKVLDDASWFYEYASPDLQTEWLSLEQEAELGSIDSELIRKCLSVLILRIKDEMEKIEPEKAKEAIRKQLRKNLHQRQ